MKTDKEKTRETVDRLSRKRAAKPPKQLTPEQEERVQESGVSRGLKLGLARQAEKAG